ncbi:hypothetical protein J3R82DRAFT_3916 [Butyriboletus roseoflavus]|nr:hypothetical protein J3R82DRAFT_3916 [Butyriboletus roseoflavus]
MVRCRPYQLAPTAVFAIGAALLPLHVAPKSWTRFNNARLLPHTLAMSSTSTNATSWIQSRLTALYEGPSLQDVFDQAFSPTCEVRLSHVAHPLQTFKDDLASRRAAATHVSVTWGADFISTNDDDKSEQPAVVTGALVVTRSLPFRIRVGPAQRHTHVHFSAKIERDASVQGDDQRRITSFYYTSVDRTPQIHFAVPRGAKEGGQ